jgi:hypothetical protein
MERAASLCGSPNPALLFKNQTGKDCTRLIYLNSNAGQLEKG